MKEIRWGMVPGCDNLSRTNYMKNGIVLTTIYGKDNINNIQTYGTGNIKNIIYHFNNSNTEIINNHPRKQQSKKQCEKGVALEPTSTLEAHPLPPTANVNQEKNPRSPDPRHRTIPAHHATDTERHTKHILHTTHSARSIAIERRALDTRLR